MKKHALIVAVLMSATLVLVACGKKTGSGDTGTPTPETPQVGVSNDVITINPDPISFKADKVSVKIMWQLPKDSPYTFPRNGITFKEGIEDGNTRSASEEFVKCTPEAEGKVYTCTNLKTVKGRYKYVITLQGGTKTPPPLDPIVVNGD